MRTSRPVKRVRYQVGQCLEFRAEATSPPHVGQAGNEQGVAAPDQVVHVAQVRLRSQAAFVDGQGVAARQDVPVRGTADHRRAADLCEKGLPQRRIAIVQERARQPHRSDIGVFRLGKQPQGVHARPLSCVLCRPGRACKEESYHERRRRARQSTATSFTQYSMSLPARGWLKSSVTTWFSMLTTFAGMGCAFPRRGPSDRLADGKVLPVRHFVGGKALKRAFVVEAVGVLGLDADGALVADLHGRKRRLQRLHHLMTAEGYLVRLVLAVAHEHRAVKQASPIEEAHAVSCLWHAHAPFCGVRSEVEEGLVPALRGEEEPFHRLDLAVVVDQRGGQLFGVAAYLRSQGPSCPRPRSSFRGPSSRRSLHPPR